MAGDMVYGFFTNKPFVSIELGGNIYKIHMDYFINRKNKTEKYNPILNLELNNPDNVTTPYGIGTSYNAGHYRDLSLIIYGNSTQSDAFEKGYGW